MLAAAAIVDLASRLRASTRVDPARTPALTAFLRDSATRLGSEASALLGGATLTALAGAVSAEDDRALIEAGVHFRARFRVGNIGVPLVCGIDRRSVDTLTETMFGGDGTESFDGDRPASPFEMQIARGIMTAAAEALEAAFAQVAPLSLVFTGEETAGADRKVSTGDWLQVSYALGTTAGRVEVVVLLPQAVLVSLRQSATSAPEIPVPANDTDPRWTRSVHGEVSRADVVLQAVLTEPGLTLADIANMRVGATLPLRASPRSRVDLLCEGQTLSHGVLGQRDGAYTVLVGPHEDPSAASNPAEMDAR